MSTQTLNLVGYGKLLGKALIRVLKDEGEYGRFLAEEIAKNLTK